MNAKVAEMTETVAVRPIELVDFRTKEKEVAISIDENTDVKALKIYKKEYKIVKILNLAVKRIMGTLENSRIRAQAVNPSISGIITSSTIRSG